MVPSRQGDDRGYKPTAIGEAVSHPSTATVQTYGIGLAKRGHPPKVGVIAETADFVIVTSLKAI